MQVRGLEGVKQIAASDNHTCAVRADGSLWCWGSNELGQIAAGRIHHLDAWSRWPTGAAESGLGTAPRRIDGGIDAARAAGAK